MENLTTSEQSAFESGMRAAAAQQVDTRKVVAFLESIKDRLPVGKQYEGGELRAMIIDLEKRGVKVPDRKLKDIDPSEIRSLRTAIDNSNISLTKIFGSAPEKRLHDDESEMLYKIKYQQQWFWLECEKAGTTPEEVEEKAAEARDPLMRLVNARNPKRK